MRCATMTITEGIFLMKRFLFLAALAVAAVPAFAADIGGSIYVNQPGLYGRIDIGNFPRPQVIYQQPVLIQQVLVAPQPIYLHVPPGHAKNWRKHCARYNACGQPVYFVQENWYENVYVPEYRGDRGGNHGGERGDERDDDHRGKKDKHDGGKGHGGGKGHDHDDR